MESQLEKILEDKLKNLSLHTIIEDLESNSSTEKKNKQIYNLKEEINKIRQSSYISKFADKPTQMMFYYPRPTLADMLIEEDEYVQ